MRLEPQQKGTSYVVLLDGNEVDNYPTLEEAITKVNECRCTFPGAHLEIAVFKNGLRTSTALSMPDAVDAVLSEWSEWVPTSGWTTCTGGFQTRTEQRTRTIITPPQNGGTIPGLMWEVRAVSQPCIETPVPVDCVLSAYGPWTAIEAWGPCVADLQSRTERRTRTIITPPANGGAVCGALSEDRTVSQACLSPVDCVLSAWGAWTPLTDWTTCVANLQTRNEQRVRTIVTAPANGGAACASPLTETRSVSQGCQVASTHDPDGTRVPTTKSTAIDFNGAVWSLSGAQVFKDGSWWNGGTATQLLIANFGQLYALSGTTWYRADAAGFWVSVGPTDPFTGGVPTPVDCVLSAFSAWSPTSAWSACVNGTQSRTEQRTRTIVTPPTGGGAACGALTETQTVSQACLSPVDCVLSAFGPWTPVGNWSTCVNNSQTRQETRSRTVITAPANGGVACGALTETQTVSQTCGDIDCVLSAWGAWVPSGNWGPCVNSVQTREETRTRTVLVQPLNNGIPCSALSETHTVSQACTVAQPGSPDGTRVPQNGLTVTDGLMRVWSLEAGSGHVLRDGAWLAGGAGVEILIANFSKIYVKTSGGTWYRWDDPPQGGWIDVGQNDPYTGVPDPEPDPITGVVTTGSINATSTTLVVANIAGFSVGDWLTVEIGKEPGLGQRGTKGVGGNWPSDARGYASFNAMVSALGSNPTTSRFAWINNPSDPDYAMVWHAWGDGSAWFQMAWLNVSGPMSRGQYYNAMIVPRSLVAQIQSITPGAGTTGSFLLHNGPTNGQAKVSVSGANVYRDSTTDINSAIAAGGSLTLTDGDYYCANVLHIEGKTNFVLAGTTRDGTRLISPRGVPPLTLETHSPGTVIHHLTVQGNTRDHGFGFNYNDIGISGSIRGGVDYGIDDDHFQAGTGNGMGLFFLQGANNHEVHHCLINDSGTAAIYAGFVDGVWWHHNELRQQDPHREYLQWQLYPDTAGNVIIEDNFLNFTNVMCGLDCFKCFGPIVRRNTCINALLSMNGSGGYLIEDNTQTFTAQSFYEANMINRGNPCFALTDAIGVVYQHSGGTIRNHTITQNGFIGLGNWSAIGLKVSDNHWNVVVDNFVNSAPNYQDGAPMLGAQAIDSSGLNFVARNCGFHGKAKWTPQNQEFNHAVVFTLRASSSGWTGNTFYDDPGSFFQF
jgi:hypothetical protein